MSFIRTVNLCVPTEKKIEWEEIKSGELTNIIALKRLINLMWINSINVYKNSIRSENFCIERALTNWKFEETPNAEIPQMIVLVRIQILDAVRRSTRQWQRILTSMCKPGNENILTAGISLGVYRKNSRAPLYHLTAYSASSSVSWSQISCAISPLSTALGMVTCNIRNPNDSSVRAPKMRKIKIKFFRKLVRMWENLRHADVDVDGMRSRSTLMPEWIISL